MSKYRAQIIISPFSNEESDEIVLVMIRLSVAESYPVGDELGHSDALRAANG